MVRKNYNKRAFVFVLMLLSLIFFCPSLSQADFSKYKLEKIDGWARYINNKGDVFVTLSNQFFVYNNGNLIEFPLADKYEENFKMLGFSDNREILYRIYDDKVIRFFLTNINGSKKLIYEYETEDDDSISPAAYVSLFLSKYGYIYGRRYYYNFGTYGITKTCAIINGNEICLDCYRNSICGLFIEDINSRGQAIGFEERDYSSTPALIMKEKVSPISVLGSYSCDSGSYCPKMCIANNGDIACGKQLLKGDNLIVLPPWNYYEPAGFTEEGVLILKGGTYDSPILYKDGKWTRLIFLVTENPSGVNIQNYADSNDKGMILANCYEGSCIATPLTPAANNSGKNLGIPNLTTPDTPSGLVCNPINAATGNKLNYEIDYIGFPGTFISIQRYYNSLDSASTAFGKGWRSSYHRSIKSSGVSAQVTREDGRVDNFLLSAGYWEADSDVTSRLFATESGWELVRKNDTTEHYDLEGKLTSIINRNGLATTLTYDENQRLVIVTGPFGHALSFSYDASNHISEVTDPSGGTYTYTYDENNNLISVGYPGNVLRKYMYDDSDFVNALTGIVDENGNRFSTYCYDDKGHSISTEHAGGVQKTTIEYNSEGKSSATTTLGYCCDYSFLEQFELLKPVSLSSDSCSCGNRQYRYDANGFLESRTDFNGNVTFFTRDNRGLELTRTEAYGAALARTVTTTWHQTFHLPLSISEPNRTTSFSYDEKGNLLKKSVTAGGYARSWSYTYNTNGQVLTKTDPLGNVTTYTYNNRGGIATITTALGHVTRITDYDDNGRPLKFIDPNGLVTVLAYDVRGRLITETHGAEVTRYAYDAVGQLTRITLPNNSFLNFSYDEAHRLVGISDALGNRISYTLDAMGNINKEEIFDADSQLRRTHSMTYDSLNRLLKDIGAKNQTSTYGYDNNSNMTKITDPLNNVTQNVYDALNRLVQITDPKGQSAFFKYNKDDLPVAVTDTRNLVTRYTYDGLKNLTDISSPDTGTITRTFDAAGNILTETDARGKTTTHVYDALNRVTKMTFSDGKTIVFEYDQGKNGIGQLTKITDDSGSTTWKYDIQGRVLQKQQQVKSVTLTTSYQYDSDTGNLTTLTYPSSKKVTFTYGDSSGLPTAISVDGNSLLSGMQYEPFGVLSSWTFGNGSSHTRTYDLNGRISEISITGGVKNKIGYTYDAADRITGISGSNLVPSIDSRSSTHVYAQNSNRLTSTSGSLTQTYSYDASGNLVQDGEHTYTYDVRGRLVQVESGGDVTTYSLNGLGQRVFKNGPTDTTIFVYSEDGYLLGEYDANGNAVQETVWVGDMPIGVLKGNTRYYINPDHLGAPHTITDQSDQVAWKWQHDPYGNGQPEQGTPQTLVYNLRFPGQYHDAESGLNYNYYRHYNPMVGRYVQSDPIGLAGGLNTYVYGVGNPISNVDIYGENTLSMGIMERLIVWYKGFKRIEKGTKLPKKVWDATKELATNDPHDPVGCETLGLLSEFGSVLGPTKQVCDTAGNQWKARSHILETFDPYSRTRSAIQRINQSND